MNLLFGLVLRVILCIRIIAISIVNLIILPRHFHEEIWRLAPRLHFLKLHYGTNGGLVFTGPLIYNFHG